MFFFFTTFLSNLIDQSSWINLPVNHFLNCRHEQQLDLSTLQPPSSSSSFEPSSSSIQTGSISIIHIYRVYQRNLARGTVDLGIGSITWVISFIANLLKSNNWIEYELADYPILTIWPSSWVVTICTFVGQMSTYPDMFMENYQKPWCAVIF